MSAVQIFELDGSKIGSVEDFEDQFSALAFVPGWYGRNLNALWDVLTGIIEVPTKLVWRDADTSRRAMGRDFDRILQVMNDAQTKTASFQERFEYELCGAEA